MSLSYEHTLLALNLFFSTLFFLGGFKVVHHLRLMHAHEYAKNLYLFGIPIAIGIFTLHSVYQRAFNHADITLVAPVYLIPSLLACYMLGLSVLNTVNLRGLPFKELGYATIASGISAFSIPYFFHHAVQASPIEINLLSAIFAIFITFITVLLTMVTIYWLKNYDGAKRNALKLLFSIEISFGFLASHIAIDLSFTSNTHKILGALNNQYFVLLLILVPVVLFLTSLLLIAFYDKAQAVAAKRLGFNHTKSLINGQLAHDPLTKLPNRDALNHNLILEAKRCDRNKSALALAYIDLDHFKPVNDNFGHHIGDLLLMEVSDRLNKAMRNCDYLARAGGDEFIAILGQITDTQSVVTVVQRMVDTLSEPFIIENHLIEISASIGVAIYPQDGDLEKLKVSADAAMYKAKENGKNQYRFYDAEIEHASDQMQKTRLALLQAINQNEFKLLYQPKVDAITQIAHGAEALLRWEHPTLGTLTPNAFIEAAERFGLIEEINEWVMTQACKTIQAAQSRGIDLSVSVNLSNQQFRNNSLVENIKSVMKKFKVEPRNLILEISETNAIHDQEKFKASIKKLKSCGLKVSLDDFGLHPFSLTYLQNLDISEVKLDRSFTINVSQSSSSLAVVEAVVKLAHALNLNVVAEGVEEEAQRIALVSTGCDQMQGYLFARPVAQEALFTVFEELQTKSDPTHALLKSMRKR